jgi:hypothetical protein
MKSTNRRLFITNTAVATAGTALSFAPHAAYTIVHHVFFWLKNPTSETDRDQLVAGVKTLAKIETVRELYVGIAASTEKRDVVDNSWGVSELIFFSDLAAQATYQNHPVHLDFVKNYSHLWEKVVVYDAQKV